MAEKLHQIRRPTPRQPRMRSPSSTPIAPEIQLAMCTNCEATILAEAIICPHCGESRPICMVCHVPYSPTDSLLICPYCHSGAHRSHILEYLKVKGTCPNCQANLDSRDLIDPSLEGTQTSRSFSPQHLCMVCNHALGVTDSILECPHCGGKAHRSHLLEYLKVKGKCPRCQAFIDNHDLLEK